MKNTGMGVGLGAAMIAAAFVGDQSDLVKIAAIAGACVLTIAGKWFDSRAAK